MASVLRHDDEYFISYLCRGHDSEHLRDAIRDAVMDNVMHIERNDTYCPELRLLLDLYDGALNSGSYRAPADYLCAFERVRASCEDDTWDAEFSRLYERYIKTPCANYRSVTRNIFTAILANQGSLKIVDLGCGNGALLESALVHAAPDSQIEIIAVETGAVTPFDEIMRLLHSIGCLLVF